MFIITEDTPNPNTLKFLPGKDVMGEKQGIHINSKEKAGDSPLVKNLFEIDGITEIYLGRDFISITKSEGEWKHLKPSILEIIMDFYVGGNSVKELDVVHFDDENPFPVNPEDQEIIDQIIEILETKVRPAVAQDGGDITFFGFDKGIVFLKMKGACSGCPSSTVTLKGGIENMLRHYIPEVMEVRSV
jgi:Fe-S cluster biogenesis protein NfuA